MRGRGLCGMIMMTETVSVVCEGGVSDRGEGFSPVCEDDDMRDKSEGVVCETDDDMRDR